jgi:GT2 family glycosyltransferase
LITALVINRGRRDLLDRCLSSIEASVGLADPVELIVIDNGSDDGSAAMVRARHPQARLVELAENEGFAPAVVRGTGMASGEWLALINNDAWLEPDALARLEAAGTADARVGTVTAQVRFAGAPDRINTAGLEIDNLGIAYDRAAGQRAETDGLAPCEVFGASGCVTMYRVAMLAGIGGFDAAFFAFGEDADVSWRARMAGWGCLYEPRALAHHLGSATAGEGSAFKYELVGRNRVRLLAKNATAGQLLRWGWAMLAYDLAYIGFVLMTDRTLAPLRGRLEGLRQWRTVRTAAASGRRPVSLVGHDGWRRALAMRSAYAQYSGGSR